MDHETRLALLEQTAKHADQRLTDLEDFQSTILERLDRHLEQNANHQILLVQCLARASTSIDSLAETVKDIARSAASADEKASLAVLKVSRMETVGITLMKTSSVLGVVCTLAWGIFTYIANKM
jgi:hypothetical protein